MTMAVRLPPTCLCPQKADSILLFTKVYDPRTEQLSYGGRMYMKKTFKLKVRVGTGSWLVVSG